MPLISLSKSCKFTKKNDWNGWRYTILPEKWPQLNRPCKVATVICMTYKIYLSPPCQMYLVCGSRKRLVDVAQVFFRQEYVKTSGIFLHMGDTACLGYGDDILSAHHPRQHDLCGRGVMPAGYLYQCIVVTQTPFAQRRVGHDGYMMLSAPRNKVVFNSTVFKVVEHLVGGAVRAVRQFCPS